MAFTFQQLIDKARVPLNDADKDRYADSELLDYARDAYLMAYRHRPDLFIGLFSSLPAFSALGLTSAFPVDDMYLPVVADYITARAEYKDDEHVVSQRAAQLMAMFGAGLGSP